MHLLKEKEKRRKGSGEKKSAETRLEIEEINLWSADKSFDETNVDGNHSKDIIYSTLFNSFPVRIFNIIPNNVF